MTSVAWISRLHPILAMFPKTTSVLKQEDIIPFTDSNCIGNKALFLLIGSRVDEYFQRAIQGFEGHGDKALKFIKSKCANITADDTHHFHHLFTTICIKESESATSYFRWFTFGRTEAEGAGNLYTSDALVNYPPAGMCTTKNPRYDTAVQLFQLEREGGKTFTLEDL